MDGLQQHVHFFSFVLLVFGSGGKPGKSSRPYLSSRRLKADADATSVWPALVDDQAAVPRLVAEFAVVVARFARRLAMHLLPGVNELVQERGQGLFRWPVREIATVQCGLADQAKAVVIRVKAPRRPRIESVDA